MGHRQHRFSLMVGGVVVVIGVLTACSASSNDNSAAGGSTADRVAPAQAGSATGGTAAVSDSDRAQRTVVQTSAVIRSAEISLTNKNLGKVRSSVDELLAAVGGSVDKANTTNDRRGRIQSSTLTLRIPVDKFDPTRDALERLGTVKSSAESEKDVTTEVIDTAERVQTLQNSLDRLQRFQRSATDVRDLIRYEEQITTRQSELLSLKAQQTYLSDQTSMSTITLHLSTPETYVAPPSALEDAGFLTGLEGGWHALVGSVVVALTVVGAVLPFLVAFILVGVPAWVLLRDLRRRRQPLTGSARGQ